MTPAVVAEESATARRRLLVVDDEEQNIELVSRAFRSRFEIHQAKNGQEALTVARQIRPDVIITDERMPAMTGVEFLSQIKEELPRTVRILVTGYTDYGALTQAINNADIDRYVEKPFHTVDLKTVVDSLLRAADLETERNGLLEKLEDANGQLVDSEEHLRQLVTERTKELAEANVRLKELAARDALTGLFNQRSFAEHLRIEIARSYRYKRTFSLLFVDVDDFKRVNDQFGHPAGDDVLRRLADLMSQVNGHGVRRSDFVARYGGEEFCLILPETPIEGACLKADRLREAIAAHTWTSIIPAVTGAITVSIGVAGYPQHGSTAEALVAAADRALYAAKRSGKNRTVAADGAV